MAEVADVLEDGGASAGRQTRIGRGLANPGNGFFGAWAGIAIDGSERLLCGRERPSMGR